MGSLAAWETCLGAPNPKGCRRGATLLVSNSRRRGATLLVKCHGKYGVPVTEETASRPSLSWFCLTSFRSIGSTRYTSPLPVPAPYGPMPSSELQLREEEKGLQAHAHVLCKPTKGSPGGKHPVGNLAVRSPERSFSEATRYAAKNREKPS